MDKIEHAKRHMELHKALDELVANYLEHNTNKRLSNSSVMELIYWSSKQCDPTTADFEEFSVVGG